MVVTSKEVRGNAPLLEQTVTICYANKQFGRSELLPISYVEQGRGERIVLYIHGLGGSKTDFSNRMFPYLPKRGWRHIAIDLPGFGRTPALTVDQNGIESYREVIRLVMDALGVAKAYLYGMSMGGMTALSFGAEYPERTLAVAAQGAPISGKNFPFGLSLLSCLIAEWGRRGSLFLWPWGINTFRPLERTLKNFVFTHPSRVREVFQHLMTEEEVATATPDVKVIGVSDFLAADARAVAEAGYSILRTDLTNVLREYCVPVLVLDGERPRSQALQTTQRLMQLLPRGLADSHLFKGVGHMATILCPKEAAKVATRFFRKSHSMRPA